jgi:hypothetical protein
MCATRRANHPAVIEQVGLHDVRDTLADHRAKPRMAELLLAERDGNRERIGDPLRRFEVVERAGLFKVDRIDIFQHAADRNRVLRIIRAVRVGGSLSSPTPGGQRDQRLGRGRASDCAHAAPRMPTVRSRFVDETLEIVDFVARGVAATLATSACSSA